MKKTDGNSIFTFFAAIFGLVVFLIIQPLLALISFIGLGLIALLSILDVFIKPRR